MFSFSLMMDVSNDTYQTLSIQDKIFVRQDLFKSRGKTGTASGYAKAFGITEEQAEDILLEWEGQCLALNCGCDDIHTVRQIL